MSNARPLILAALIGSAGAGEVYVTGSLGYQFAHGGCYAAGVRMPMCLWDRTDVRPMVGAVELGYAHTAGRFTFSVFARHDSQPQVNDYGINQAGVSAKLTLWRKP